MAQSSFPFENIDTTETQFSQMFRTLQDGVNGTYGGTELQVSVGTGLAVDVATGQAMVRGHFYISSGTEALALATADATNDRLDVVVLRLDPTANSVVLAVKTGTPAGSPVAPALVQTDAGIYEMALANVLVPATSGVPTTITDRREYMGTRIGLWSDDTRPTEVFPHVGFNTDGGTFEGYDPVADLWGPIGGGGGVTISATAPSDPSDGDLWWDSDDGEMYVYYGADSVWVSAAGPSVAVQSTAPTGYEGQLWLDDTDGSMYVYYTDPGGGSSSWIGAVSRSGGILQVVSTNKTDIFSTSSTSYVDVTDLSLSITPRSTSSKILARVNVVTGHSGGDDVLLRVLRDATPINNHDGEDYYLNIRPSQNDVTADYRQPHGGNFFEHLDSPSSTSTLTYKVQMKTTANTGYVNRTRQDGFYAVSTITLIEVAG